MANPQIENGYTKIANELLEGIIKFPMSDYEHRIFWLIVRKTYGYKKKTDWISQNQIVRETGILKQHVSRTIKKLLDKNMIIKNNRDIGVQKDYDLWKLPKQVTSEKLPKQVTRVTYTGYKSNLNRGTQKKKLIQKKGNTPYQEMVDHYNKHRDKMPEVLIISNPRENTMRTRYKKYGDKIFTLFEKAGKSDFLNGKNDKNWIAGFDWLLNEKNMVKVLEGNYDNKSKPSGPKVKHV